MYNSSMSKTTYPLALPKDMISEVRRTAKETGLSMADAMRQAIKFGLPQVRRRLATEEDFAEIAAESWGPAPGIIWDKLPEQP